MSIFLRASVMLILWTACLSAQHSDIAVYQDATGRLTTHEATGGQPPSRVFQSDFEFWGQFDAYAGDEPGFQQSGTNPPAGYGPLTADLTLQLNAVPIHLPGSGVGNLLFWDGLSSEVVYGEVPENHVLFIEDSTGQTEIALNGSPARFENLVAAVTDANGGMHQHMTFAVENNGLPPDDGIYVVGWELSAIGFDKSQLVVVAFSAPTLAAAVQDQSAAWLQAHVDQFRVAGDFDGNGTYELTDVDALVSAIVGGADRPEFDLTLDGSVDADDLMRWREIAGSQLYDATTTPGLPTSGSPVLPGDANLDGFVDVQDFNVWNSHKLSASAAWSAGDFNADGVVDISDFNIWNSHKLQSVVPGRPRAVPEPRFAPWCLACLWAVARHRTVDAGAV